MEGGTKIEPLADWPPVFLSKQRFSLSLLGPKNLINDVGGRFRSAGLDLDLKRVFAGRLADHHPQAHVGDAILLPGVQAGGEVFG